MSILLKRRKQKPLAPRAFDKVDPPVSPQNRRRVKQSVEATDRTTLNEFSGKKCIKFAGELNNYF